MVELPLDPLLFAQEQLGFVGSRQRVCKAGEEVGEASEASAR